MSIIAASIPFFFLLIGVELVVARVRREPLLRLDDSIADLSLGILSQLTGIFLKLFTVGIYIIVVQTLAVQRFTALPAWIDRTPFPAAAAWPGIGIDWAALGSWAVVFVLVDLCYYWSHRLSHVVNVLWAGHVVHHSSEEYNLTVALRQSSLHGLFTWVFYLPLALAGIPAGMFVVCYALNLVYQFWIHTRAVRRLGPLEWVMNTPSHHRVHHGVNPRYLDRNYAGVFIVWDRMFGTFEPEREAPVYGITTPLASWNPLWANVHVFVEIARRTRRTAGWRDRFRVVFGHPGWRPAAEGGPVPPPVVAPEHYQKFDPAAPAPLRAYALIHFLVVLLTSVQLLAMAASHGLWELAPLVFYVAVSLVNIGGLLERQRWAYPMELARLATAAVSALALAASGTIGPLSAAAVVVASVVSAAWLTPLRRHLTAPTELSMV